VYCTARTLALKAAESYNRWCNYFVNAWNVMKVQSFRLHNVTDIKKWFIDSRGARPSDIAYVHGCFALLGAEQNALGQEIHGLIHRDPRTPPYTGPPMDNFLTFNQHIRTSRMHLRSVRANGTFAQREWADQALSLVDNATEYLQANADRWVNPSSNGPVRSQDIRVAEDTCTEEEGEQQLNASTPPFRASFRTHQSQRWHSNHPCANNMSVAAEGAHRGKRRKKDTPTVETMATVDNPPFDHDQCQVCQDEGTLIICDGCHLSWHLLCAMPPLEQVPAGEFHCVHCTPSTSVASAPAMDGVESQDRHSEILTQPFLGEDHSQPVLMEETEFIPIPGQQTNAWGTGEQDNLAGLAVDRELSLQLDGACYIAPEQVLRQDTVQQLLKAAKRAFKTFLPGPTAVGHITGDAHQIRLSQIDPTLSTDVAVQLRGSVALQRRIQQAYPSSRGFEIDHLMVICSGDKPQFLHADGHVDNGLACILHLTAGESTLVLPRRSQKGDLTCPRAAVRCHLCGARRVPSNKAWGDYCTVFHHGYVCEGEAKCQTPQETTYDPAAPPHTSIYLYVLYIYMCVCLCVCV
jgi:hypothetical protein